jgi:hypothetical protein
VVRGFLFLFLTALAFGESLEDAAHALARSVAARLSANESARVVTRNVSSLGRMEVTRVQSIMDQALRRRVRNPVTVEVAVTISENLRGFLLIAEWNHEDARMVEMTPYRPDPPAPPDRATLTLRKKLLWDQPAPILDLVVIEDQMLVLDNAGVTRYLHRQAVETAPTNATAVRDPRGRLEVSGPSLTIHLPGSTCQGTWTPVLAFRCEPGGEISAARNTFEGPVFSRARLGEVELVAELDGKTHIYDAAKNPSGLIDDWGSDFAMVNTCAGPRVAVSGAGDPESSDSVAIYDMVHAVPIRASDPADFPGPVTALWPAQASALTIDAALAIARNLATGHYEAYSLTVDCNR